MNLIETVLFTASIFLDCYEAPRGQLDSKKYHKLRLKLCQAQFKLKVKLIFVLKFKLKRSMILYFWDLVAGWVGVEKLRLKIYPLPTQLKLKFELSLATGNNYILFTELKVYSKKIEHVVVNSEQSIHLHLSWCYIIL